MPKTKFTPEMEKTLRAAAKAQKTKTGKPFDEEGLLKKVRRKLQLMYYGKEYHAAMTKKKKEKPKKEPEKGPKETAASLLVGYGRGRGVRK